MAEEKEVVVTYYGASDARGVDELNSLLAQGWKVVGKEEESWIEPDDKLHCLAITYTLRKERSKDY